MAVIYCRVSSKEQVENLSLSTQEIECRKFCDKLSVGVAKVFVEEGESAKTANRPKFRELIDFCSANKGVVTTVVVYSLNRFARNNHDHHVIRALLARSGIILRSVTEPIDESASGKLMEAILAGFAEFDNTVRADRTKAGMKAALEMGRWSFKAPLGYQHGKGKTEPSLIHDIERGDLIKKAFELYATGRYTKTQVLDKITKLGLKTQHGKAVSLSTFEQLLKKPVYAGWISTSMIALKKGDFEPLVTEDIFYKVQAVLSGKRLPIVPHLRNHPDFPLRHFAVCGHCGRPLTGSWSKGRKNHYAYYHCPSNGCRQINLRKEELEKRFVAFLEKLQPNPSYVRLFSEVVLDAWNTRQDENVLLHSTLKRKVEDLAERKQRLIDAFVYKQAISQAVYSEQLESVEQGIAMARMELHEAELEEFDIESALSLAKHVLLNAARLWQELSLEQKQRFQKLLFPQGIEIENGEVRTAETCCVFSLLQTKPDGKHGMVTLTGFEPVYPP